MRFGEVAALLRRALEANQLSTSDAGTVARCAPRANMSIHLPPMNGRLGVGPVGSDGGGGEDASSGGGGMPADSGGGGGGGSEGSRPASSEVPMAHAQVGGWVWAGGGGAECAHVCVRVGGEHQPDVCCCCCRSPAPAPLPAPLTPPSSPPLQVLKHAAGVSASGSALPLAQPAPSTARRDAADPAGASMVGGGGAMGDDDDEDMAGARLPACLAAGVVGCWQAGRLPPPVRPHTHARPPPSFAALPCPHPPTPTHPPRRRWR